MNEQWYITETYNAWWNWNNRIFSWCRTKLYFKLYFPKVNSVLKERRLIKDEIEKAFKSLKRQILWFWCIWCKYYYISAWIHKSAIAKDFQWITNSEHTSDCIHIMKDNNLSFFFVNSLVSGRVIPLITLSLNLLVLYMTHSFKTNTH